MSKPHTFNPGHELKKLASERAWLTHQIADMAQGDADATRHQKICRRLQRVESAIASLQSQQIIMTEHAMLRYLERVKGIDFTELCQQVITEQLKTQIKTLGDGKYPIGDGYRVVVKNNAILTVVK